MRIADQAEDQRQTLPPNHQSHVLKEIRWTLLHQSLILQIRDEMCS